MASNLVDVQVIQLDQDRFPWLAFLITPTKGLEYIRTGNFLKSLLIINVRQKACFRNYVILRT
jgi:hypothetical protein